MTRLPPEDPGQAGRQDRLDRYADLAGSFALLDDVGLHTMVAAAPVISEGIGGTAKVVHVDGVPVFVKVIPLTDLERQPENLRSTADLFGLPVGCHYGVGSPGFGAWRELAAQSLSSSWVLGGRSEAFPLAYHWRVLDLPAWAGALPAELADADEAASHWRGSAAVRARVEAIATSSAALVLLLEHLPLSLPDWLAGEVALGEGAATAAINMTARNLVGEVTFMNRAGLLHFDAHLDNLRTDGRHICFTDFGLVGSPRFAMSPAEAAFLAANATHDTCHTITRLVDWLVTAFSDVADWHERDGFVRRCAEGHDPVELLPAARVIVNRYAPVAVVINEFYRCLHLEDRATPYPTEKAEQACGMAGLVGPRR